MGSQRAQVGTGGRGAAGQAARLAAPLLLLALGACTERISELDPRPGISNFFSATHLEGREPPPGLDQPWPRLADVPARPVPPDAAARARLSESLAEDRARSRSPLDPTGQGPLPPAEAGPPAPARLAAAPSIRLEEPAAAAPVALPVPAAPAGAPTGDAPAPVSAPPLPAAPTPIAPPPPPARELLAPPPPSADLLAPRRD